jgi:hypothetical protein
MIPTKRRDKVMVITLNFTWLSVIFILYVLSVLGMYNLLMNRVIPGIHWGNILFCMLWPATLPFSGAVLILALINYLVRKI